MSARLKRFTILTTLFLIFSTTLFGQLPINVKGQIIWCNSSSQPNDIRVQILKNNSVVQRAFTDLSGNFSFHDFINSDFFTLNISYYGQALKQTQTAVEIHGKNGYTDKGFSVCCQDISQCVRDSLFTNWNNHLLRIEYYGMPKYSDSQMGLVSSKFGVRYKNLGCVLRSDQKQTNEEIESFLTQKLGGNWKKVLWNEIERSTPNRKTVTGH